ncbi:MAG: ABC-type amino acid transport [Microbacteriaceae bacterium]|nr:ABC-type amino acid transport [Microbacteriaceae bacterium]
MGSSKTVKTFALTVGAIAALLLAGCASTPAAGSAPGASSSPNALYKSSPALVKIQKAGVFNIGVDTEPPLSSISGGKAVGVIPDVLAEFVKRVGLTVKINAVATPFSSMIPEVQSNRIDTIAAGMYNTPARAQVVNFTEPIVYNPGTLIVAPGNPKKIKGINAASLHGLTVGSYAGTTLLTELQAIAAKDPSIQVKAFTTAPLLALAVSQGQVDAGYIDQVSGSYFLKQDSTLKYEVLTNLAGADPKSETGDCLPVNKSDPEFVTLFNKIYDQMKADGTAAKIMTKNGLTPPASFYNLK